ncbi:HAMP domain-containing sensor histidine kinase [Prevotella sp. P6B1]|uniref:sensor histidine kinase n=1 Tax=Prevotella sp. P6B1 TaxID=1410613 RepID=UPI0009E07458|nr:HAMP domain-containing sensor histidine kinase [Prevotella sp. P6B1]
MKRNLLTPAISIAVVCLLLMSLAGCHNDASFKKRCDDAERMVYFAYLDKDYNRILELTDSVEKLGLFSEGKADYWMGYAYDRMMQKRMAELYWKRGLTAVENSTGDDNISVYAGIAHRLAGLKYLWGEYEEALKIAQPAIDRLEKLGCDTTSEYTNLLIYAGCCQSRHGLSEQATNNIFNRAYDLHLDFIKRHPYATSYRDAIVGVISISYNYIEIHDYEKALIWLDRMSELIRGYEPVKDARPDYAEKQWARYYIYRAITLEGLHRSEEAAECYHTFLKTGMSRTPEGKNLGGTYLGVAGRWQEAADNFKNLKELIKEYKVDYTLEMIQKVMLKKYEANRNAGRLDSAKAISVDIIEHLDSAINVSRHADAVEQEAVHQKELEMAAEREKILHTRQAWRIMALIILILIMLIYIVLRHRSQARLAKALERAKESDRMKTAFVQHISHEIRTPLNIITGFAQVVSNPDYDLSVEDRNRIMADISHNTTEITNFVNELLELSESESQSMYQLNDEVDVTAVCQEAIDASEATNQGRLALSVNSELPDGYRLKSNAAAIRKILDRLMSNALKFTDKGRVTIYIKTVDSQLEIAVEDTGKGIPRDQQERVFERFYKVDSFVQGIGLGLTVARRSAQLLGGTLTIDPNYTAGARFVISLPVTI